MVVVIDKLSVCNFLLQQEYNILNQLQYSWDIEQIVLVLIVFRFRELEARPGKQIGLFIFILYCSRVE